MPKYRRRKAHQDLMCKCQNTRLRDVKSSRKLIFTMVEQPEMTRRLAEMNQANAVKKARRRHRRAGRAYGKVNAHHSHKSFEPGCLVLTLDLPNRKASIHTSSHWYLDDSPMPRSPSARPRRLTPQSTPQLRLKQPTRATVELRSPARPESSPGPASCRTATTEAWTQARPCATTG